MLIRTATIDDLPAIASVEAECFPPAEAATDEMYAKADMHDADGKWQMIFGVNTIPEYRNHGYAGKLIEQAIADAKAQNRSGLVLTCKDKLINYYAKFGFKNEGISESTHGDVQWYQMRLTL